MSRSIPRWTPEQRAPFLRPDGRWDCVKLTPEITQMRERGKTLGEVAAIMGIPGNTIRNAAKLEIEPAEHVLMVRLAEELGISHRALRQHVKEKGLPYRRFGQKIMFSAKVAAQVADHYRAVLPRDVDPQEWWTLKQLADFFGLSTSAMSQRVYRLPEGTIRHQRILAEGNQHRYSADDARRYKSQQPVTLTAPPADTVPLPELASLLKIKKITLQQYATRGAPHVRIQRGRVSRIYFRPHELADWLMQCSHRVPRSIGRTLAAHLERRKAA